MITSFTKSTLKEVIKEVEELLNDYGKDKNLHFSFSGGKYSSTEFSPKVTIKVQKSASGEPVLSDEERWYNVKRTQLNLPELHEFFTGPDGKKYKFTGYKMSRPKYPVSYETATGSKYKCDENYAKSLAKNYVETALYRNRQSREGVS